MLGNWEKSDLNILQHVFSSIHGKVFMKTVLTCYHSFISHKFEWLKTETGPSIQTGVHILYLYLILLLSNIK